MKLNVFWASVLATASGAAVLAPAAQAAEPATGAYVGGVVSVNRTPGLGNSADNALAGQGITSSTSAETSSNNPGLKLGYRLNRNLAVEATYDRLGNMNLQSGVTAPAADTASGNWKAHGYGLSVLGIQPINDKWSVYGRAGLTQWHTALTSTSNAGGATAVDARSTNTSLTLGAGTSYALSSNLDATAEFLRYSRVGTDATGRNGVNAVNVGLRYHFQ